MKTSALSLLTLLLSLPILFGNDTPTAIFVVDDQTGPELLEKHGIRPVAISDFDPLITVALQSGCAYRVFHQVVDEDSRDNRLTALIVRAQSMGPAPTPIPRGLPLTKLTRARQDYAAAEESWQGTAVAEAARLAVDIKIFVDSVSSAQSCVNARFREALATRGGRDFSRSDVATCIAHANNVLGAKGRRFIVINSDADDLPGWTKPRQTPFTAAELDPGIELVFVNISNVPQRAAMFAGLPNRIRTAPSLRDAMEEIARESSSPVP